MMNPALPLAEGTRLENFEIRRQLGRGGFGVTYLATEFAPTASGSSEPSILREVAIKEFFPQGIAWRGDNSRVIPTQDDGSENAFTGAMKAFLREAQAIARLDHPAIVRIYRVFQSNGTAYFVMPYLQGKSLRDVLKVRGRLSQKEIEKYILPVLDGLEEAHRVGMVHRDIKPDNIMIREGTLRPVLIDFGAARVSAANEANQYTRMSELVAYTPGYAPIEQYARAAQENRHDPHTDLYAFCATLYHCVTGKAPPESSLRAIESHSGRLDPMEPALTPERETAYSAALLAGIDWGLEIAAINRPQTVAALRDCLLGVKPAPPRSTMTVSKPSVVIDDDATVVIDRSGRGLREDAPAETSAPAPVPPPAPPSGPSERRSLVKPGLIVGALLLIAAAIGGVLLLNSGGTEQAVVEEQATQAVRDLEAEVGALLQRAEAAFAAEDGPASALLTASTTVDAGRAALADGNLEAAQSWFEQGRTQIRQVTVTFLEKQRDAHLSAAEINMQAGDVSAAERALARGDDVVDLLKGFQ